MTMTMMTMVATEMDSSEPVPSQLLDYTHPVQEQHAGLAFNLLYYGLAIPVSYVGNLFTYVIVCKLLVYRDSTSDVLVGGLALNDVLTAIIVFTPSLISAARGKYFDSRTMCEFSAVTTVWYIYTTFAMLVLISADRWLAITRPFFYKRLSVTSFKLKAFMALVGFGCLMLASLPLLRYPVSLKAGWYCAPVKITPTHPQHHHHPTCPHIHHPPTPNNINTTNTTINATHVTATASTLTIPIYATTTTTTTTYTTTNDNNNNTNNTHNTIHHIATTNPPTTTPINTTTTRAILANINPATTTKTINMPTTTTTTTSNSTTTTTTATATATEMASAAAAADPASRGSAGSVVAMLEELSPVPETMYIKLVYLVVGISMMVGFNVSIAITLKRRPFGDAASREVDRKFARIMGVVAALFLFTWLPHLMAQATCLARSPVCSKFEFWAMKIVNVGVAVNPVVYGVMKTTYRRGYLYLVRLTLHYLTCTLLPMPTYGEEIFDLRERVRPVRLDSSGSVMTINHNSSISRQHHHRALSLTTPSPTPPSPPPSSPAPPPPPSSSCPSHAHTDQRADTVVPSLKHTTPRPEQQPQLQLQQQQQIV